MSELSDKTRKRLLNDMCEAHSDLNIFYGIIAILEGGTMSADSNKAVSYIIRHCRLASSKCLDRYDAVREKLGVPAP